MRLLLDMGAIKTGGGVQLALNFVRHIQGRQRLGDELFVLVAAGSLLEQEVRQLRAATIWTSPMRYISRAWFEYAVLRELLRKNQISIVFTFFGAGIPCPKGVRSIVTVAYPIICYPESAYWRFERPFRKLFSRMRNWFRCRRLGKATLILAETEVMRTRLARQLNMPAERIHILPPAVSVFAESVQRQTSSGIVTFVIVSDNSHHKNIWRLYAVARELQRRGLRDFVFVLTINKSQFLYDIPERTIDETIIKKYFRFLGPVAPTRIMDVYRSADVMVQLSDLESFSNNYIEAWRVGLPIIASDRDFARHICEESAVYVEPHDPVAAAGVFAEVIQNQDLRVRLSAAGRERLRTLPTIDARCEMIWWEIDAVASQ